MSGSRDIGIVRSPEQVVYRDIKKVGKFDEYAERRSAATDFVILVSRFSYAETFCNLLLIYATLIAQSPQSFAENFFTGHIRHPFQISRVLLTKRTLRRILRLS